MDTVTYEEIWGALPNMKQEHADTIKAQLLARIVAVGVKGVSEILTGAPQEFKLQAWGAWAQAADLSGYHLKDILALQVTETAEVVYPLISKWAQVAQVRRYNADDIRKIAAQLTVTADYVALMRNWASSTDFGKYKLADISELMSEISDDEAVITIGTNWLAQAAHARRELRALSAKQVDKINALHLPQAVIEVWDKARRN